MHNKRDGVASLVADPPPNTDTATLPIAYGVPHFCYMDALITWEEIHQFAIPHFT